jgi:hypothetical protein
LKRSCKKLLKDLKLTYDRAMNWANWRNPSWFIVRLGKRARDY